MKNEMKRDLHRLERIMMKMNRDMKAKKEHKSHKACVVLDSFRDYQAKVAFMEQEKAEVLYQHKLDLESIL